VQLSADVASGDTVFEVRRFLGNGESGAKDVNREAYLDTEALRQRNRPAKSPARDGALARKRLGHRRASGLENSPPGEIDHEAVSAAGGVLSGKGGDAHVEALLVNGIDQHVCGIRSLLQVGIKEEQDVGVALHSIKGPQVPNAVLHCRALTTISTQFENVRSGLASNDGGSIARAIVNNKNVVDRWNLRNRCNGLRDSRLLVERRNDCAH
jgi:hypothetical protein